MIRIVSLTALVVGLGLAIQPARAQQKLPTAAEVLAKLKEKRERGGIQTYKLEFERTSFDKGRASGTCRVVEEFQIDWKTGKFRLAGWDGCAPKPYEQIEAFDGEKIKTQHREVTREGKPTGDGAWKYGLNTGRMNSRTFQAEYWPVFFHKGTLRTVDDLYYPGHFAFDPDAEKFFVHSEVMKNGRKCISLKTFPEHPVAQMQYEYFIDPKKDFAVVGFTYYQKAAPFFALDIDVGEAKQLGQWALKGWTFTMHGPNGRVDQAIKVKVTDFVEDVKIGENNKFDIAPPEGAKVGRSHYELPEGTQDQKVDFYEYKVVDGKLVQTAGPKPPLWDRVRDNWHWFALGAGLAVAAFVGFRARRGWGRGPAAPPAPAGE